MWINFWNAFTKLTAWPLQKLAFRTKIFYENRAVQGRHIRGPAILISNHTSVYDYAVFLFVFFSRTLRCQMAELLFEKKPLGLLLRLLGGLRVDRNSHDFGFLRESEDILARGGVVEIFPESRLPKEGEPRPLPFKPSAAWLALSSGVPVIPLYTNGRYFQRKRAAVVIGTPFYAGDLAETGLTDRETIARVTERMREKVMALESLLDERYI